MNPMHLWLKLILDSFKAPLKIAFLALRATQNKAFLCVLVSLCWIFRCSL
jgi:hypothetical protein